MKTFFKTASLATICVSFAGNVLAQQSLPLSLEQMFELAETQNRDLAVMDLAVSEAEEGIQVAKSGRLPDLDVNLAVSYLGNANVFAREWKDFQVAHLPHFGNNFAFEASQIIYSGGAVTASIDLAKMKRKMALLSKEEMRENVRLMLAGCYLQLCQLQNEQKVYEQNIAQTQQLIDEINAKHAQGVALKNDVTRHELQLKGYELALTQISNNREVLNHQLVIALALSEDTHIEVNPLALIQEGKDTTKKQAIASSERDVTQSEQAWQSEVPIAQLYGTAQAQALLESMKEIYGILLLVAIGAWLFAALFHPAIRPINLFHPLFTTIRSSLSMDMLKKMRAEKRSE